MKMDREWETEPNELDFNDDATGLPCRMRRGPGGHWCGYVALPTGHPLYGKGYREAVTVPKGYMDREAKVDEDYGAIALFTASLVAKPDEDVWPLDLAVRCHGGLTYAAVRDGDWWLGFDCAHSGDLCREGQSRQALRRHSGDFVAYAVGHRMTPSQVESIAAWHDEKAEHAETARQKTRHEVTSFKLSKLANDLRKLNAA